MHRLTYGHEDPLTVTFIAVTTERLGSLHRRLNLEVCRWVSRSHRPSSPHPSLPVRFAQPIVVDHSFNRLKPRPNFGEITTPSGTGACDMRSTGTGSDAVFAHAASCLGPCAALPPHDDVARRTERGRFTIAAERTHAPTASVDPETTDNPPLSHSRSRAISIVHRRENPASHSPPQPNGRQPPRIDSDNDAHGCSTVDPLPLTDSRPTNRIDSPMSSAPVTPMYKNRR